MYSYVVGTLVYAASIIVVHAYTYTASFDVFTGSSGMSTGNLRRLHLLLNLTYYHYIVMFRIDSGCGRE